MVPSSTQMPMGIPGMFDRYLQQPAPATSNAAAADRERSASAESANWEQRIHRVRAYSAERREDAENQVRSGTPGSFRFYSRTDSERNKVGLFYKPLRGPMCNPIEVPDSVDLQRLSSFLSMNPSYVVSELDLQTLFQLPNVQAAAAGPGPGPIVSQLPPGVSAPLAQAAAPVAQTVASATVMASGVNMNGAAAVSTNGSSSTAQQPSWESRTASIKNYIAASKDLATQQVQSGPAGTFRFYQGPEGIGRLFIKLSAATVRIEIPNDINLHGLASHLTLNYQNIANAEAVLSCVNRFVVSNASPGPGPILAAAPNISANASYVLVPNQVAQAARQQTAPAHDVSNLVVVNESAATRSLVNTGDFRFYTKPSSTSEDRNLKRIMIKLPFANMIFELEDSLTFSDVYNQINTTQGFLARLSALTCRSEEHALIKLGERPIQIVKNSANNPTKIVLGYNGQVITVDVPETITTRQLLNEMEKNYCLLKSGARTRDEAITRLNSSPIGTKVFYRSSQNPNEIRVIERMPCSNVANPVITYTIGADQDFIGTLELINSSETQLRQLRQVPDLIDRNAEAAHKRMSSLGRYGLWIDENQLMGATRLPGLEGDRPRIFTLSAGSEISPFYLVALLDNPNNQFNVLQLAHLTASCEAVAESSLEDEPIGSYRVINGTSSFILMIKTITGIQEIDVPSDRQLFEFLEGAIA